MAPLNPTAEALLLHLILPAVTKGAAKTLGNTWPTSKAAWVSALVALGGALITAVVILPVLRWKHRRHHEALEAAAAAEADASKG